MSSATGMPARLVTHSWTGLLGTVCEGSLCIFSTIPVGQTPNLLPLEDASQAIPSFFSPHDVALAISAEEHKASHGEGEEGGASSFDRSTSVLF